MRKTVNQSSENRTKDIHIRFTENEWNQLQTLSQDFTMSVSEFIRWSVFQRKITMRIMIDDESGPLSKIRYQLDRIGNNINQIARVLNSGFVDPGMFREELKDMFAEIHGEIDLLNRVQSEVNSRWYKRISKYSKYYPINKTSKANE